MQNKFHKFVIALAVVFTQLSCAQIEKTANYNEQNLTVEERNYANKYWTSLSGITWNRWSNIEKKSDRDFYLEQRLRKDSAAYKELKSNTAAPSPTPASGQ